VTRSKSIRRIGWTAAVLAVCVLSLNAQAGRRNGGQKNQRQQQRQSQRDNGHKHRDARASEPSRQSSRRNNEASRSRKSRQASNQTKQRRALKSNRESTAHARVVANTRQGADWGVNAQRKHQLERQSELRQKAQRLEKRTITSRHELRAAKQKLEAKTQRLRQEDRNRNQRLNLKATTLNHAANHRKPAVHLSNNYYIRPSYSHRSYRHSGYKSHDSYSGHYDSDGRFGFRISFGSHNRSHVAYSHSDYDYSCCTPGYYTTRWVPPLTSYRYDYCNRPYPVVIRNGYYKQVWVPGYCSRGIHHHRGAY